MTKDGVEYFLTDDAAKFLDVSAQTIRVWEKQGKLKALKTPGGVRLFAQSELERLRSERTA